MGLLGHPPPSEGFPQLSTRCCTLSHSHCCFPAPQPAPRCLSWENQFGSSPTEHLPGSPVAGPAQHPSASATPSEAELCIALQVHTSVANVILSKEPFFLLPDQSGKTLQQAAALQHAVENPPPARQGWFSQGNNW